MLKINRSSFAVSFVFLLIPFGRKPQKLQKPRWCVAFSFFWSLSQFHNMLAVPFSTFYLRMFLVEFFADNFRCIFLQFRFTHAPTHALGHNTRISWIFSVACCSLLIAFCPLLFALRSPLHVVVSHLVRNERLCQSPETVWPFILYGPADFPAHRDKPKNGKGNVRRERRRKENRERRLLPIKCSTFSVSGKSRAQMREFYSQTSAEAAAPCDGPLLWRRRCAKEMATHTGHKRATSSRRRCLAAVAANVGVCCCFLLPLPLPHAHALTQTENAYVGTVVTQGDERK